MSALVATCGDFEGIADTRVEYGPPPETFTEIVADTLHGDVILDPYRWLEDGDSPEARAWSERQNEYTDALFAQLPRRAELARLLTPIVKTDVMSPPVQGGGRYVYSMRRADDEISMLYYRDGLTGEGRVLVDPHDMSEDYTTSVRFVDVSDDGKLLVYAVRRGGVDEVSLHVRDIDTGEDLPDSLPAARQGRVQLTPDNSGFYYTSYGRLGDRPRIYYHELGTDTAEDMEVFGEGYGIADVPFVQLSPDGRWMLATVFRGGSWGASELYLKEMEADAKWVEIINDGRSRTWGEFAGDRLLLTTNLDADNSRVMIADLARPAVENWLEFLPEREDVVIERAYAIGGYYFVSYLEDVLPRVDQYDVEGNLVRAIEFETLGSVYGPRGEWDGKDVFVTFTSFHVPTTIYRIDVTTGERDVWFQVEVPIDIDAFQVKRVWYSSKDGTRIPMFIVHKNGLSLNGENPAGLFGYGGFNMSIIPTFMPTAAAWLELGGVIAIPNVRGGGEFGEEWHRAGMLENKQNVFDDFIAAAEYLIKEGYTKPEMLGISGNSNGGLLVGAAMTQRPELFSAVICTYPVLDMLRYDQFLVAPQWVNEFGSAQDPEQFEYLKAYSPYHNVIDGIEYPATLFITGDDDTRVDPMHARKMTARMQAANAGSNPILLRYHSSRGHAGELPMSRRIDDLVDTYAFLQWQLIRKPAHSD